jgi:hypothetical protein
VAAVIPAVDVGADSALRSLTEPLVPRRMAWRSIIENRTATRFSHDAWVEVKCTWMREFSVSQSVTLESLCAASVVHY